MLRSHSASYAEGLWLYTARAANDMFTHMFRRSNMFAYDIKAPFDLHLQ